MQFNRVSAATAAKNKYQAVIIGSGFGSSFFLHQALKYIKGQILVLEWGDFKDWNQQIETKQNGTIASQDSFINKAEKPWNTTIGFGGGTNCWYGQTPRFHPNDFKIRTLYGVGKDWPISYTELEPYYCAAESVMSISGDASMGSELPRSMPFPQPPHNGSDIDVLMKRAMPDKHFIMPTARARVATSTRGTCCANLKCNHCPVQAKFTAINGFTGIYADTRVDICFNAEVVSLDATVDTVNKVRFRCEGTEYGVEGESVVLGANGIQSPAILLRSAMAFGDTGIGLHEQVGVDVEVLLDGVENFNGSTITTGLNYSLNDGAFRKDWASCLIHFENRWKHGFRKEFGRWRETLPLTVMAEDLRQTSNYVTIDKSTGKAQVVYQGASDYAYRGIDNAMQQLPSILASLPVEKIILRGERPTESHVQGTLCMGDKTDNSVIDKNQVHHQYRNLVVVGSSVFASCSTANPSLTVSALSLRAAEKYFG